MAQRSVAMWQLLVALLPVILPQAGGGPAHSSQQHNTVYQEKGEVRATLSLASALWEALGFIFLSLSVQLFPEMSSVQSQWLQPQKQPCFHQHLTRQAATPGPRSVLTSSQKPFRIACPSQAPNTYGLGFILGLTLLSCIHY